jgi:large subunit ribosomal protein L6
VSRIGRKPIEIPEDVKVDIKGKILTVTGKRGELSWRFPESISAKQSESTIIVKRKGDSKTNKSLHGLSRALIANMVKGISEGFEKVLEITGTGYSAEMKGKSVLLNVGYSHPVLFIPPEDVKIEVPKNLTIKVSGIDKQRVGQVAARIRSICPPEPYKGKGIRYQGEYIRRKAGKKVGVK